jgi:ribosomal protein S10
MVGSKAFGDYPLPFAKVREPVIQSPDSQSSLESQFQI